MAVSNALTMPMAFKDVRGVPVFYPDHGAINGLEQVAIMSLPFRGDTVALIDGVLNEHPYLQWAGRLRQDG